MLLACLLGIGILIAVEVIHVRDNRKQNKQTGQFIEGLQNFVSDQDTDGLTNFDKTIHVITESIGKAQALTTVAALRGTVGQGVKQAEAALEAEAIENYPAAAVMQALPKKLQKNPVAQLGLALVMQKAQQAQQGGGNGHIPGYTDEYVRRPHR